MTYKDDLYIDWSEPVIYKLNRAAFDKYIKPVHGSVAQGYLVKLKTRDMRAHDCCVYLISRNITPGLSFGYPHLRYDGRCYFGSYDNVSWLPIVQPASGHQVIDNYALYGSASLGSAMIDYFDSLELSAKVLNVLVASCPHHALMVGHTVEFCIPIQSY